MCDAMKPEAPVTSATGADTSSCSPALEAIFIKPMREEFRYNVVTVCIHGL